MGPSGIIVNLGPVPATFVRNGDCYLCVRTRSAPGLEVALVWKRYNLINCQTVAEFVSPLQNFDEIVCSVLKTTMDLETCCSDESECFDLPEMLQNLLVSVEHAIERVPLDDVAFPCPQCAQYVPLEREEIESPDVCTCQCFCAQEINVVLKKDTSMQTSPMFEFVGSIPHIDSDEDDDKESIKSGERIYFLKQFSRARFYLFYSSVFFLDIFYIRVTVTFRRAHVKVKEETRDKTSEQLKTPFRVV